MGWNKYVLRVENVKLNSLQVRFLCITLLFLVWLIIQFTIWSCLGIRTGSDTKVYVDAAHKMLSGEMPDGRLLWYSTYIAFLALVSTIGGGFPLVVLLQILLSGVAAVALWFAVKKMTDNFWISFIVVLLYLCWFKIHQWNIFIYTESLFTSLAIITFALLLSLRHPYHYILFSALFLLTFFVRPTGFCFMIGILSYFLQKTAVHKRMKLVLGMVLLLSGLTLLNNMLSQFTLIESYVKGEIIYPDITLDINIPHDLVIPDPSFTPLSRLGRFAFYNPLYFLKISLLKLFLFVANVKPYFSFILA